MKKRLALTLLLVIGLTFLCSCGVNDVAGTTFQVSDVTVEFSDGLTSDEQTMKLNTMRTTLNMSNALKQELFDYQAERILGELGTVSFAFGTDGTGVKKAEESEQPFTYTVEDKTVKVVTASETIEFTYKNGQLLNVAEAKGLKVTVAYGEKTLTAGGIVAIVLGALVLIFAVLCVACKIGCFAKIPFLLKVFTKINGFFEKIKK